MASFRDYRDKVSILQIAEFLGYKPLKGKYTPARPVLQDGAGDTILIKNPTNPSTQVYWNLGNSSEHGSVIDFVKNNINRFAMSGRNDIDSLNIILSHFSGIEYDNSKYMNDHVTVQKIFCENDYKTSIPKLANLKYLTDGRKLNPETVQSFLPFIRIVENMGYKNIGFPFTVADSDNTVRGYEIRNFGFKSFSAGGDKVNATWNAIFADNRDAVKNIFFFESAIDAMSFYELKKNDKLDMENAVFISSGGFPCVEQFSHVLKGFPDTVKLFACHDNDLAGHLYDILLACVRAKQTCIKNKLNESVEFITKEDTFTLPNDRVTLKNFLHKAGFLSDVIALKPYQCKDWNEALQNKGVLSAVKKPVFD